MLYFFNMQKINKKNFFYIILYTGLFVFCFSTYFYVSSSIDPQASMDASFYHVMSKQLYDGKGFNAPFVWHYLRHYKQIVHPIDYWLPLGIVYYYISILIFGLKKQIILNILIWSLLSILIFKDTYTHTKNYFYAYIAYITFVFCGKNFFYVLTTDNNVIYAVLGYLLFKLLAQKENSTNNDILLGIVCGLMILDRIEGVIFAFTAIITKTLYTNNIKKGLLIAFITLIIISPWLIRNKIYLNTFWPSNTKALFITSYSDIFYKDFTGSPKAYFAKGIKWIINNKLYGLKNALISLVATPSMFLFIPFWLTGFIYLWHKEGKFVFGYLILFILLCGLLFTFQTAKGTGLHISAAFLPHFSIILACGLFYTFNELKFKKSSKFIVSLIIIFWAIYFTHIGNKNSIKSYTTDNIAYKKLFNKYKISKNEKIVSFNPVYITNLTETYGVMASEKIENGPIKIADEFNCNYILLDSRIKFEGKINNKKWQKVAIASYSPNKKVSITVTLLKRQQ